MVKLILHPEAKRELREAAAYYQERREGLGEELLGEIRQLANKIRQNPRRCGFVSPEYRCCRVKRFPYGIIYRIDGEEVFVAAVMHFKRKPGYWEKRTRESSQGRRPGP